MPRKAQWIHGSFSALYAVLSIRDIVAYIKPVPCKSYWVYRSKSAPEDEKSWSTSPKSLLFLLAFEGRAIPNHALRSLALPLRPPVTNMSSFVIRFPWDTRGTRLRLPVISSSLPRNILLHWRPPRLHHQLSFDLELPFCSTWNFTDFTDLTLNQIADGTSIVQVCT